MQAPAIGNEKCVEKLNQMKKYLPFIDFMINKIKKKVDTLPLESQLVKFQHLRSMISERNEKTNWNVIVRVEDVIEQLVVKLNYKDTNHTVGEESTGMGNKMDGNNTRETGISTTTNNELDVTSPVRNSSSSSETSVMTVDNSKAQTVGTTNTVDTLKHSSSISGGENVEVIRMSNMSDPRLNKTWSLIPIEDSIPDVNIRRIMETNFNKDLDGNIAARRPKSNRDTKYSLSPGVPRETRPHTDSLSSNSGMLTQSYPQPSTSQQTLSQSTKSLTDSNNKNQTSSSSGHRSVTYKNPNYRSTYRERRTVYDHVEIPLGNKVEDELDREHSREQCVNPVRDPRLERAVYPSIGVQGRFSDLRVGARLSDRTSSDSYKSHGSAKGFTGPKKDSGSNEEDDLEVVEIISQRRSRSTDVSERERSHMSLTNEKDRRQSTGSGNNDDLLESNTRKRKSLDERPVDKGKRKKTQISSLNDNELENFVRENHQALPHLSTLRPSEIRAAIQALGIETIEGPSDSPSETDLQDLDEFMNSTQTSLEDLNSEISVIENYDLEAGNRSPEHQMKEGNRVKNTNPAVKDSENVITLECDDDSPIDTGNDKESNKNDFTMGTSDEVNPNSQSSRKKGLLELPLPKTDETNESTSQEEPARVSKPSEESNVNKGEHVGPSISVQSSKPIVRKHSFHSPTILSPPNYHTKNIVYGNWLPSALPPPIIPLQGNNSLIRPNTLLDPRLAMASSSQTYHGMLFPMANINVNQMVVTPGFQQPILYSPLVNTMPGHDATIINPSHPSEAKSYAEYKRLKNEEMRKLHYQTPLPKLSPNTSSESRVGGGPPGEEIEPKKTQFFESPQYKRRGGNNCFRGGRGTRGMNNRTHRRYLSYIDTRPRYTENPNERARKDEDRNKKADGEKTSTDAEETISPLDSLYRSEPKFQTGRGYGLQHFKIPKITRSSISVDGGTKFYTENTRTNSRDEEDSDRFEDSTNTNKDDDNSTHKEEENCEYSEQIVDKSKNDKDVSPEENEKNIPPEKTTDDNKNKTDAKEKQREKHDSLEQETTKSENDKEKEIESSIEEEDKTLSEKEAKGNKSKKSTKQKGSENDDSLEQTKRKTKNDKHISSKQEESTTPLEIKTKKNKNKKDTKQKEENHDLLEQETSKNSNDKEKEKKSSAEGKNKTFPEKKTMGNKNKKGTKRKGSENLDASEQVKKKTKSDKNVNPEEEESKTPPEKTKNENTSKKDSKVKGRGNRNSSAKISNKSSNDKENEVGSPTEEENRTFPGKTTQKKDTKRKARGNRDSLQQATGRTQSYRKEKLKGGKNRDIPTKTNNSNKGATKVRETVEENIDSRDETVSDKEKDNNVEEDLDSHDATSNATEASDTDQSDGNSLCRVTTTNTEETGERNMKSHEVTENTRENNSNTDQSDGNLPSRKKNTNTRKRNGNRNTKSKKVNILDGKSTSREETAKATGGRYTDQSDGPSLCHETTPNSEKNDINVDRNIKSQEASDDTRKDNSNTNQSDGNFSSRETTAKTKLRSRKMVKRNEDGKSNSCEETKNATENSNTNESDGHSLCREVASNTEENDRIEISLEKQSKRIDNEKDEDGSGDETTQHFEEEIEQGESSNAHLDVEATKARKSLGAEHNTNRDAPLLERSNTIQNIQEEKNKSPVASKESVTSEWVETLIRRHAGPKSEKIAHVLEKISQLSEEKLQTIERIINSENGSLEDDDVKKGEKSTESLGGNAEKKSTDESTNKGQKSLSQETEEKEIEEATEKETEANTETKTSKTSGDSLSSNDNEEKSEQRDSSVADVKKTKRRPRIRRRRVGMDFGKRKRNKKKAQKPTQKPLSEQFTSESAQPEGANAGNLNSGEAQEPSLEQPANESAPEKIRLDQEPEIKRKPKGRTKTELDRLHDDIRCMFITHEVMAATGQRSCRMLKTVVNNTDNSDIVTENAIPVEKQNRKVSPSKRSRSAGSRKTKSTAILSPTVTHETRAGPIVEEYHKSIKWPRIVMQKIDLDNFKYGQKITDACVKFSGRKGSNKAIRSEKKWKNQPNASLIYNEDVPRKIKSKRPNKKSTNKRSKDKKKTEKETSPPERMELTKHQESCQGKVTEEHPVMNQRDMSPVRVSRGEKENTDEGLGNDSLLNYSLERKEVVYECKLCSLVTDKISAHYKTDHPESEVLISRLSVTEAADALKEAAENDFEDTSLEDAPLDQVRNVLLARPRGSSHYYCRMCGKPGKTSIFSFFVHMIHHTGEYRFRCPSKVCKMTGPFRSSIKTHVRTFHPERRFKLFWDQIRLNSMPAEFGNLYGFICSKCNFVQVFRKNLEKHIARRHGGDKNIAIIKINLSSKNPPVEAEDKINPQEDEQNRANDNEPTEQGNPNEYNVENTAHEEADKVPEDQTKQEKIKQAFNQRLDEFTGLMKSAESEEEVESKKPFLDAELATDIEVDDSDSYLLKPETDSEAVTEVNLEANLETNFESSLGMHLKGSSEPNLELQFEAGSERNLKAQQETHSETNLEFDQMDLDECADLRKFTTIRGSDIIDPLESSDSRDTDSGDAATENTDARGTESPFTNADSILREDITETFKVGPLAAHLVANGDVFYECFIKGCLFSSKSYETFEKHLKISHASGRWKGNCQVCQAKDKSPKRWPTVVFALPTALRHLKTHARTRFTQRSGNVNPSTEDDCIYKREMSEKDSFYPRTPLLRVRNLLGDRLSRPRDTLETATVQNSVGSVAREEPTATCCIEESTNENLMFTIQDVRSLNTEVGSGSGIQFDEVVSPVKNVREPTKKVTGQPVIVRSCPTRQIAIRPETSALPIEVGHLQVVQDPASNEVVLSSLPDTSPVCIRSSLPRQHQASRFPFQSVMISTPGSLRPPTQIVCPTTTPSTNLQTVVPSDVIMEPEPQPSTSSSDSNAAVEQAVVNSAEIGMPSTTKMLRRWSVVKIGKGPTLPPSQPGEVAEEYSSLVMRSVLPFGNKTVKVTNIYEEMLTKGKLCHLFKCMATECSFTCNKQTMFDRHIKSHEADKKGKTAMFSKKGKKMYSWQQCSYCCEVVVNPSSALSQHILNVHGHCTYQCAFCFFRAVSMNYVIIHQNLAHKERVESPAPVIYKCKKLSNGPTIPAGLEMQARKQCVRPYHCDQCGSKFLVTQEFMNHLVKKHQSVTAYTCHICKNLCFKADRLVAHYKLHSFCTYQCSYCLHGTEAEWEMFLHLCNFHFTQPAVVYMRAWVEGSDVQKNESSLDCLKVITYDEVITPDCVLEQDSEDEGDDNLVINEPQDLSSIVAELGIITESEPDSSVPIMEELASIANNPQDVSVTALLPNAKFSSESESGSETVLLSSGLGTSYGRETSASEPVENNNMNTSIGEMGLETVNYQTPVVSQPKILPRFDVTFDTVAHSSRRRTIEDESRATTSSSNLLKESATITPTVNPLPPAIHKLPPVVLTTKTGVTGYLQRESLTTAMSKTRQTEEEPAASSFENSNVAGRSWDQQSVVPFQQESSINVESNVLITPESCFLSSNNTGEREVTEISSDETSQEETQNSTEDVTNENDIYDNEMEESSTESTRDQTTSNSILPIGRTSTSPNKRLESENSVEENLETNPTEEPSTSAAFPTDLPRTRFSALRSSFKMNESKAELKKGGKSTSKKNFVQELSGESLYICGNRGCYFNAPNERQLENHLLVCDDSRNFPLLECPHCSKMFKQNMYYLEHLKVHGVKKLSCGLCSYKAAVKSSIIRHVKQKHRCKEFKSLPTEPPQEGYLVYYPKNYKKEKQDFKANGYAPGDEDKLPRQSVYLVNVKCAKCPYFTKVRSNMVRHLKIHVKSAETEGMVVPSTAPTNPVPCLDAKEKMFDKMTNLAASSQLAQANAKSAIEALTSEEIAKLPQFIDEHMRYKCCLSDCNYITVDDGMLKHHIKALHTEVTYYSCPHCKSTVHTDIRHVALDKIGFHLKHHDSKLYKCPHCIYFHYQKTILEKHLIDKHPDRRYFVHTVREPKPGPTTEEEIELSTTVWRCALCNDFQSPNKSGALDHLSKNHGTRSMYKCLLCDMKSNHFQSFTPHFASKHPGENISYFPMIVKETVTGLESTAVLESANDHFDTTPLWQRGASRVRHIRGILIEEEEVTRKKGKKTVEYTESTKTSSPVRTSTTVPSRTSTPATASRTETSTSAPTPTPAQTQSSSLARTSVSTSALAQTSTSAPVPASIRTQTSTLAQSSISTPASAPARNSTSTRVVKKSKKLSEDRRDSKERSTNSPTTSKTKIKEQILALPHEENDIVFWVNSIIEQQRIEIERKRQLSEEEGSSSGDSQNSSKKKKKKSDENNSK